MSWTRFAREDLVAKISSTEYMCSLCRVTQTYIEEFRHAEGCVLADPDVTAIRVQALSETRPEICIPCRVDKWDCPALNGWANDTHRRLLIACEHYRQENA